MAPRKGLNKPLPAPPPRRDMRTPEARQRSVEQLRPHQFKKGNPGGPGRPKGVRYLSESIGGLLTVSACEIPAFKAWCEDHGLDARKMRVGDVLAKRHLEHVLDGSVGFMQALFDRVEGVLTQKITQAINGQMNVSDAANLARALKEKGEPDDDGQ